MSCWMMVHLMSVLSGLRTPTIRLSFHFRLSSLPLMYSAVEVLSWPRFSDLRTTTLCFSYWRISSIKLMCQSLRPLVHNLPKFSSYVRASRHLTPSIPNSWTLSTPSKKLKKRWTVPIRFLPLRSFWRPRETDQVTAIELARYIKRLIFLIFLKVQTLIRSFQPTTR